tara:strand:- start:16585 stop:17340 length:756 start_codon:yes stop_codon:yes gene_type:complete
MSQNSNCIYTCIYGGYEYLRDPEYREPDTDYIVFTDDPNLKSDFWEVRLVPNETDLHGAKFHKRMKCLPQEWLSNYKTSVWLDANLRIIKPNYMEWIRDNSPSNSITLYKHFCLAGRHRFCVYKELTESMQTAKYREDIPKFLKQAEDYDNDGFPQEWGLYQSTFIYRNHEDESITNLCRYWFNQVMKYSNKFPQCQSSLAYSLWKNKTKFDVFKNKKVWDTDDYEIFFHVPENSNPNQKHSYAYKMDGKI